MKITRRTFLALTAVQATALTLGVPAYAQAPAPEITLDMTMKEVEQHPLIQATRFHVDYLGETRYQREEWEQKTLREYLGRKEDQIIVDALNLFLENYKAGIQVTYPLYTREEIAQVPTRDTAMLYYFPPKEAGGKYALVVDGNAVISTSELCEGLSTAWELQQKGYAVFVLRYRSGEQAGDNAPLEDLTRAVAYITDHAQELGVRPEDYALISYSSGGQIAGLFATEKYGCAQYGLPKPGAVFMAYPVLDLSLVAPVYHIVMDPMEFGWRYYWSNVADDVTDDYPPVYLWYGLDDRVLKTLGMKKQAPVMAQALAEHRVPYIYHVYQHAPHAHGISLGTDAEGWLDEAVGFWEEQTAGHEN